MPCTFILTAGKRKGEECAKGCGTREYCGRHMKMVNNKSNRKQIAEDAKHEFLGGTQQPMQIEDKIKKSVFAITINSQKNISRMTPELRDKFIKILDHLFIADNILDFVDCRDGFGCLRADPTLMVQFRADYKIEVGEKYGKIHAHCLVEIDHRTVVQINMRALKQLFREYMGYGLHVNVQAKQQISSGAWEHYINKSIPTK
jgi:uncharacterized 2Fe-2S/4Fe-4S cluster protein (DUF4445 family)